MGQGQLGGTPLQSCPRCAGIWVAADALDDLLARAEAIADPIATASASTASPESTVKYLRCPSCAEFMARKNHERVSGGRCA